jgi:hypothetical protein
VHETGATPGQLTDKGIIFLAITCRQIHVKEREEKDCCNELLFAMPQQRSYVSLTLKA